MKHKIKLIFKGGGRIPKDCPFRVIFRRVVGSIRKDSPKPAKIYKPLKFDFPACLYIII